MSHALPTSTALAAEVAVSSKAEVAVSSKKAAPEQKTAQKTAKRKATAQSTLLREIKSQKKTALLFSRTLTAEQTREVYAEIAGDQADVDLGTKDKRIWLAEHFNVREEKKPEKKPKSSAIALDEEEVAGECAKIAEMREENRVMREKLAQQEQQHSQLQVQQQGTNPPPGSHVALGGADQQGAAFMQQVAAALGGHSGSVIINAPGAFSGATVFMMDPSQLPLRPAFPQQPQLQTQQLQPQQLQPQQLQPQQLQPQQLQPQQLQGQQLPPQQLQPQQLQPPQPQQQQQGYAAFANGGLQSGLGGGQGQFYQG